MLQVKNNQGVVFNVVKEGNKVKIYDSRFTDGFGELGQFVSSYYASTLLEHGSNDLNLWSDIREWSLSWINMFDVCMWILHNFTIEEKLNPMAFKL